MLWRHRAGFIGWLIVCWASGPLLSAEDSTPAATPLVTAVNSLFQTGLQSPKVSASTFEASLQSAERDLTGKHPCLDFAAYLVLTQNKSSEQALARLEAAAQSESPVLLMAREVQILRKLKERLYSEVLDDLTDLAQEVGRIPPDSPLAEDARTTARWLGIMLAYLQGPADLEQVREDARIIEAPLRAGLGDHFQDSFDLGYRQVGLLAHEISRQIIETTRLTAEKQAESVQQATERANSIEQQKTQIASASEALKSVAKEDLGDLTSRIETLEKLFETSYQNEQMLIVSQTQLRAEISSLRQRALNTPVETISSRQAFGNFRPPSRLELENAIALKELQLNSLTLELGNLIQRREQLVVQGRTLMNQRQAAAVGYQSRAGDVQKRLDALNRLQARVEGAARQQAQASPTKAPEVTVLRRQLRDLSTYSRTTFSEQRERLERLVTALSQVPPK